MTLLFLIGLPIIVLLYGVGFLGIVVQLKKAPRPFPPRWAKRHFLLTDNLRRSLWIVLVLLIVNAFVFLVPAFTSANRRGAALDGIVMIVCGIASYGLYHWSKRLLLEIANNTRVE